MSRPPRPPGNDEIADVLQRIADLLEAQHASPYRVRAWRRAAGTIRSQPSPVAGRDGDGRLEDLPGIGKSIARAVRELLSTGRIRFLERLEGEVTPEELFTTLPGLGEELAARIHDALDVETLEDLEAAAHDGRLAKVKGFGPRRVEALRAELDSLLRHAARRRARAFRGRDRDARGGKGEDVPPVGLLLDVDREYRERAARGELRRIAPRRFNPTREAWLPILHVDRDGWSLTALFSNTARAHELDRTRDWVVVYFERDGVEGRSTVVTERGGRLAGRRVVRGRESECTADAERPAGDG